MPPYLYNSFVSFFGLVHAAGKAAARGWGEHIEWQSLSEGLQAAVQERKPLMVIVYATSCPHCVSLKGHFSRASHISDLSKSFVMVNLDVDAGEVPKTDDFAPDGNYVPRIMFYSPKGQLLREACKPNHKYQFNYSSDADISYMMNRVSNMFTQ